MADLPAPILSIRLVVSVAEVVLGPGEHVIGRSPDCAVCIEDPLASRRHATLVVTAEAVTIRDLGSRNGVLVNGDEIDHLQTLAEGDLITLGSQAITVRQICRARGPATSSPPADRMPRTSPLAKIVVTRRPATEDEAAIMTAMSTLGPSSVDLGRPVTAYRLIAEAAGRAVATGRAERAEKILDAPLVEVMAMFRAGTEVEDEIVEIAVQQALLLAELTHKKRWIDYVHEVYEVRRRPLPLDVADRLALIVTQ